MNGNQLFLKQAAAPGLFLSRTQGYNMVSPDTYTRGPSVLENIRKKTDTIDETWDEREKQEADRLKEKAKQERIQEENLLKKQKEDQPLLDTIQAAHIVMNDPHATPRDREKAQVTLTTVDKLRPELAEWRKADNRSRQYTLDSLVGRNGPYIRPNREIAKEVMTNPEKALDTHRLLGFSANSSSPKAPAAVDGTQAPIAVDETQTTETAPQSVARGSITEWLNQNPVLAAALGLGALGTGLGVANNGLGGGLARGAGATAGGAGGAWLANQIADETNLKGMDRLLAIAGGGLLGGGLGYGLAGAASDAVTKNANYTPEQHLATLSYGL